MVSRPWLAFSCGWSHQCARGCSESPPGSSCPGLSQVRVGAASSPPAAADRMTEQQKDAEENQTGLCLSACLSAYLCVCVCAAPV